MVEPAPEHLHLAFAAPNDRSSPGNKSGIGALGAQTSNAGVGPWARISAAPQRPTVHRRPSLRLSPRSEPPVTFAHRPALPNRSPRSAPPRRPPPRPIIASASHPPPDNPIPDNPRSQHSSRTEDAPISERRPAGATWCRRSSSRRRRRRIVRIDVPSAPPVRRFRRAARSPPTRSES